MIHDEYKFIKKPDYQKVAEKFEQELHEASKGEKNNLLFIKTYLPPQPIITQGKVQVAVIGGTNYDFAVIEFLENGEKKIEFREKGRVLPINSLEAFTTLLDTHLATKVEAIAMNLGFPLAYFPEEKGQPDGKIIKATKEHSFHGLLGHKVGEIVLDRYIRKHGNYTTVAVANDTVCLAEGDGALIVGTGFNMGIIGEEEGKKFVINLEAGNSAAYETTAELEEIDDQSVNRGANRFEKIISGYYLPLHFNLIAKKQGIELHIKKAEELAELAATEEGKAGELARELFDRSAKYVAAQIAGFYAFKGKPELMTIATEGSLFHYGYKYQKSLQYGLREHGIKKEAVTFHTANDSSLWGALKLLS